MQTGSNAQAILSVPLQRAAAASTSEEAAQSVLTAWMKAVEASGVSMVTAGETRLQVAVGRVPEWAQNATRLFQWGTALPSAVTKTPPTPNADAPPTYYTLKLDDGTVVCLWFERDDVQLDENVVGTFADMLQLVMKQHRAERKQKRSEMLAKSILRSIADPLLVLSDDRRVLLMNPAAEAVFQISAMDATDKPLSDVLNSDSLLTLIDEPVTEGRPPEWSVVLDGEEFTFLPLMSAIQTPNGDDAEGWVLALRDVSRFKRLNHNQQEFMRIVSHDLRSPLTSMQGFADMIRMGMVGEVTERQVYFVDKILSGISQMAAIVENIQDAGRFDPETGFYDMERGQVDLGEIAKTIVQNHIIPAEKQELTLELRVDDSVPILNADGNMLTRAITNLVDNAIKYTPNGGRVEVGIERDGDTVVISVADDGHGISENDQRRLFQRHVRLERKEHRQVKGTGLGLFIVQSVAQRHGGEAHVQSALGEGTTFSIHIPLRGANLIGDARG